MLVAGLACTALAQQERDDADEPPTLEERVADLEREIARLDTRLENRTIGQSGAGISFDSALLAQRIDQLERSIGTLRTDLQRVERNSDAALRAATDAQRRAAAAESAARAASRF